MNWMSGMFISEITSCLIVCLVYIFLFIKTKKAYIRILAFAWSIFCIQRLIGFFSIFTDMKMIYIFRYTLYFVAVFLFVYGMHCFIERKIKRWWIAGFIICIIGTCLALIMDLPYMLQNIFWIYGAFILIWSGINIIRAKEITSSGKYIVGWDFIAWGIHLVIYLFLVNIEGLISLGNIFSSLITSIFAFGILILYFETVFENLKKSEERYKLLIDLSPCGIFIANEEKFVFMNSTGLKILKSEKIEQIIGQPIKKFIHPDDLEQVEETLKKLLSTKMIQIGKEIKVIRIDDKVIEVEASTALITNKNQTSIIGTIRDITERRKTESLEKSIEEKTKLLKQAENLENLRNEFFANISHELRTPLNIMLGALQLRDMYHRDKPIEQKDIREEKHIKVIKQNCYRLLRLVNNLIDITKIDAGFYRADLKNCDVINIIENISLSVVDYVENKDINLIFDTDVEEKIIACDPDKIERIMLNLLSNAIKFTMKNGKILVSIKDNIDSITVSVKDNGIGIPKEKQQLVFERFKQVEKTLSRSSEGSGIGLSLVQALVKMQGGSIFLESEYGKGTEFIINLPAKLIPEEDSIKKNNFAMDKTSIERINIEFSDIYRA